MFASTMVTSGVAIGFCIGFSGVGEKNLYVLMTSSRLNS